MSSYDPRMFARRIAALGVVVLAFVVPLTMAAPAVPAANAPVSLAVPQSTGFAVLGHDCGSIQENVFVTQFDTSASYTNGYPQGDAYIWTNCSCGKDCSTTYKDWVSLTWDFRAAMVTYAVLPSAPSVNPTLSLTDSHGNEIYNQSNHAYLVLAPGFVPAPRVAGASPASAPQGTTIAISGTGFTGATALAFGTHAANFTINSDTSITAIAPAVKTGTVDIFVTGPGGASLANPSDKFTFTRTPRIASVSPSSGTADGGTKITIKGDNFIGATSVYIGSAAAFHVVNAHTITAVTPPGPDSGVTVAVTVISPYGTSNAATFRYTN
jgi:hypothetical protein